MTYLISTDPILLSPGDRMSRDEFLAHWEQMPKLKRAERIDGVVYMPSPVSRPHGRQDSLIQAWAGLCIPRSNCGGDAESTYLMESASAP